MYLGYIHLHCRHAARTLLPLSLLFILFSFLCLISGCSSGNQVSSRQVGGAALGGAAAGVGTAALGAPRPLIVGASVGGIALGYYVSTVRFDAGPIYRARGEVFIQGEYLSINLPSDKLFEPNTAEFKPRAESILDSVVAVLKRYPRSNILISGNTSGMGAPRLDQQLSEARARQVASYLWAHGINYFEAQSISGRRLTYVGYGDYFPIASDSKISKIQKNSRIQITAYPSQAALQLNKTYSGFENMGSNSDPVS